MFFKSGDRKATEERLVNKCQPLSQQLGVKLTYSFQVTKEISLLPWRTRFWACSIQRRYRRRPNHPLPSLRSRRCQTWIWQGRRRRENGLRCQSRKNNFQCGYVAALWQTSPPAILALSMAKKGRKFHDVVELDLVARGVYRIMICEPHSITSFAVIKSYPPPRLSTKECLNNAVVSRKRAREHNYGLEVLLFLIPIISIITINCILTSLTWRKQS